jgi:hypothetical protein
MNQGYKVEPYKDGDETQIVSCIIDAFKVWPFFDIECDPIDHWRWKYLDNPDHENMLLHVKYDNKIVAVAQNLLSYVKIKDKKYLAAYGTDACVHPEYQGKGIYGIMINGYINKMLQEDKIHFNYMVTVNPKVIKSKSQQAVTPYRFPYKINYMNRIEDLDFHVKKHKNKYTWKLGKLIKKATSKPIRPPDSDKDLITLKRFDDKIMPFLDRINDYYDFIRIRTVDNLNWRYLDTRGGNYLVRALMEEGEISGYAVSRINRQEDYHVGYIVDLLADPDRIENAETLLLDAINYFKENKVNSVVYQIVENHPYEKLASKYGFSGGEANRHFFYNNMGYEGKRLEGILPEKFYFSFGDLTGI